jgi:hypothetical protein
MQYVVITQILHSTLGDVFPKHNHPKPRSTQHNFKLCGRDRLGGKLSRAYSVSAAVNKPPHQTSLLCRISRTIFAARHLPQSSRQ